MTIKLLTQHDLYRCCSSNWTFYIDICWHAQGTISLLWHMYSKAFCKSCLKYRMWNSSSRPHRPDQYELHFLGFKRYLSSCTTTYLRQVFKKGRSVFRSASSSETSHDLTNNFILCIIPFIWKSKNNVSQQTEYMEGAKSHRGIGKQCKRKPDLDEIDQFTKWPKLRWCSNKWGAISSKLMWIRKVSGFIVVVSWYVSLISLQHFSSFESIDNEQAVAVKKSVHSIKILYISCNNRYFFGKII